MNKLINTVDIMEVEMTLEQMTFEVLKNENRPIKSIKIADLIIMKFPDYAKEKENNKSTNTPLNSQISAEIGAHFAGWKKLGIIRTDEKPYKYHINSSESFSGDNFRNKNNNNEPVTSKLSFSPDSRLSGSKQIQLIYEVLEGEKKPLSVSEIAKLINERDPDYVMDKEKRKTTSIPVLEQIGAEIGRSFNQGSLQKRGIHRRKEGKGPFKYYFDPSENSSIQKAEEPDIKKPPFNPAPESQNSKSIKMNKPKNIILYGPPGTGKTYNVRKYAVDIINGKDFEDTSNGGSNSNDDSGYKKSYEDFKEKGQIVFTTFHQSYCYEDFIEGIKAEADGGGNNISYKIQSGIFKELLNVAKKDENKDKNYVIIIDEINRGNIASIFGELITLIEDDKRIGAENEIKLTLPYSKEEFGIPNNINIVATMNTADRSIALLDTALRRRFEFMEMMPEPDLLKDIKVKDSGVDQGIELDKLLKKINKNIENEYDRDHTIGHGYFLKNGKEIELKEFNKLFKNKIIPLLQEYFYEDWGKIQKVLSKEFIDGQKVESSDGNKDRTVYCVSDAVKKCILGKDDFKGIYVESKEGNHSDNTSNQDESESK